MAHCVDIAALNIISERILDTGSMKGCILKYHGIAMSLFLIFIISITSTSTPVEALQDAVTPPIRGSHSMAYDPHNEVTVLFGGVSSEGGLHALGDTWLYSYSTNTWTELTLAPSPPSRDAHRLVYSNVTNEIIMYGGGSATDTWSFDCATQTWSQVVTTINPGAHWSHAMAYDPQENVVILFGGFTGEGMEGDNTWKFDCSTRQWTELNPSTTPLARYGHVMVYDESIGRIVLSNGNTAYQGHQDDTWLFDAATNTWTEVSTTGDPGALKWPGMAYDSINQRCILFGGQVGDDPVDETMVYDAQSETWTNAHPASSPSGRITSAMSFDSANEVVILFGGMGPDYGQLGDTWAYSYTTNVWTDMGGEPTSTGTSPTTITGTESPPPIAPGLDVIALIVAPVIVLVVVLLVYLIRRK